jgi:hypothetical protein
MPIFHKRKLIVLSIPKTGGTSLLTKLEGSDPANQVDWSTHVIRVKNNKGFEVNRRSGHATADEISRYFKVPWETYKKITCVRNPYDRTYSAFMQLKRFNMHHPGFGVSTADFSFEMALNWLDAHGFDTLESKVKDSRGEDFFIHWMPMVDFLSVDNNIAKMDKIYRFENYNELAKDFDVNHHLNWNPKKNKHYKDAYNAKTKEIVSRLYEKDLDCFKYTF